MFIGDRCWICCVFGVLAFFGLFTLLGVLLSRNKTTSFKDDSKTSYVQSLSQFPDLHPELCGAYTLIDPTVLCNGTTCFDCTQDIPASGYMESNDGIQCESYETKDGKLFYDNRWYSENEILDPKIYPPKTADKKHRKICCILKSIKTESCRSGFIYKCLDDDKHPQCRCESGVVCEREGTQKVLCKCFFSSCKFANQETIEDCQYKRKKPDFTSCILQFARFKCYCRSNYNLTLQADHKMCSSHHSHEASNFKEQRSNGSLHPFCMSVLFCTLLFGLALGERFS